LKSGNFTFLPTVQIKRVCKENEKKLDSDEQQRKKNKLIIGLTSKIFDFSETVIQDHQVRGLEGCCSDADSAVCFFVGSGKAGSFWFFSLTVSKLAFNPLSSSCNAYMHMCTL